MMDFAKWLGDNPVWIGVSVGVLSLALTLFLQRHKLKEEASRVSQNRRRKSDLKRDRKWRRVMAMAEHPGLISGYALVTFVRVLSVVFLTVAAAWAILKFGPSSLSRPTNLVLGAFFGHYLTGNALRLGNEVWNALLLRDSAFISVGPGGLLDRLIAPDPVKQAELEAIEELENGGRGVGMPRGLYQMLETERQSGGESET